ncbi:hypothetical protein SNE40_007284 [Patella caerulea]
MLQEIDMGNEEDNHQVLDLLGSTQRTGKRSLQYIPETDLPDCYVGKRKGPKLNMAKHYVDGGRQAHEEFMLKNLLWILVRLHSAKTSQNVPGWGGYVSKTGYAPSRLTTVEYYPIIPHAITDNKAVKECLRFSEEASNEVGQYYVITTFDLGVCMKAYPILWSDTKRYENHIVMIGTFHLICGYLKMLGKKMEGTGFSDVLIEAGLISSGSLSGVMSGKNYSRSLHCHKVMVESMERLMISKFIEENGEVVPFEKCADSVKDLIEKHVMEPTKETESSLVNDAGLRSYLADYQRFRQDVRLGQHGKTAVLWMSYMDHIWLILSLNQAVKTNNFMVYAECLSLMPDIFFSFGGQNYARYLTFFSMYMANIESSHPGSLELLKRGAISVARSFVPGSRCDVDKTIEETFMKHAKSRGGSGSSSAGLPGLQTNYSAYQRWTRSAKERVKFQQATYSFADMLDEHTGVDQHRDNRPVEKQRGEKQVIRTVAAIQSFINPFTILDKTKLYCLSSGAPASLQVTTDVLKADDAGLKAKQAFIRERLETSEKFFDPIKRLNLKTMATMNKSIKLTTTQNKTIEYKQQSDIAIKLLVKSQHLPEGTKLDLEKLMTFELTPVPYSLGTADGFLAKTDKSKGRDYLTKDWKDSPLPSDPSESLIIEDGNAIFHCLTEVPGNFGDISQKILSSALCHSSPVVVFSTDMYMVDSVKGVERLRRGCGEKLIVSGPKTKRPKDWKSFLANEDNKKQLVRTLLKTWCSDDKAKIINGREVILICEGQAFQLTSDGKTTTCNEIPSLASTQEETDSRVILYCMYAKERGFRFVRVRSPDTDILYILLHYSSLLDGINIFYETGKGKLKCCIDVTGLANFLGRNMCTALLALHAFTGSDSTSAFKGKGKLRGIKLLEKSQMYQESFAQVGNSWDIEDSLFDILEQFTCLLYNNSRIQKVNQLRFLDLQAKCDGHISTGNIDISSLPPSKSSLSQHIKRVNYQVCIWKLAHVAKPFIPKASDGHGWTIENGEMRPKWMDKSVMPREMVDILEETNYESDSESDSNECDTFVNWSSSDDDSDSDQSN